MPLWDPHARRTWRQHARGDSPQPRDPVERPLQRPPDVPAPSTSRMFREKYPGIKILVHPECMMEVVDLADVVGLDRQDHPRGRRGAARHASGPSAPSCTWSIGCSESIPSRKFTSSRRSSACARRCIASTWRISAGPGEPGGRHAGQRDRGRPKTRPAGRWSRSNECWKSNSARSILRP